LQDKFHPEILVVPLSGVSNKGGVWENELFSSFVHQYLENGKR